MEWFRSSKRNAARAAVPASVTASEPEPVEAHEPVRSPKAVFDSMADEPRIRAVPLPPIAPKKIGFTISSSRDGETGELQLTSPTLTVAKARMLFKSGWRVQVTNAAGREFALSELDEILKFE